MQMPEDLLNRKEMEASKTRKLRISEGSGTKGGRMDGNK
jgi:hypothetical protein